VKSDDYMIMGSITGILITASIYIFTHPSDVNFASWCGLIATVVGVYHWLRVIDDKRPDADGDSK
jgi:hypothetical protein